MYAAFVYPLLFLIASVRDDVQSEQISNLHALKASSVGIRYTFFFCLLGFVLFLFVLFACFLFGGGDGFFVCLVVFSSSHDPLSFS